MDQSMRTIAYVGSHTPRQCGIATFTADLSSAIRVEAPDLGCTVVALNDIGKHYAYPDQVRYEIPEASLHAYRRAADFLNVNSVDVLCLQHEYGIFGGRAGSHVLSLLRDLRMPVVTTLHTILDDPSPAQRVVMDELCALSARLVVMSDSGARLLREVHGIAPEKIDKIAHGIPALPDAAASRHRLGLGDRRVILTLGLLSPDKGIEYVIDGLGAVTDRYPDALYIVLGATHPHVRERHGEGYRLMLESRAHRLGLDHNVTFHDRFVSHEELVQFLAAADVYVTPYLNPKQIASGTLAYAVGSGKAVVSSPYRYAEELLADGRGVLVPVRDAAALATAILGLLGDDESRRQMQRRAAELGTEMAWPFVARAYLKSFGRAVAGHVRHARPARAAVVKRPPALPELNLGHLEAMTDDTGLLQHASRCIPSYDHGYCLDDNARALLLLELIAEARLRQPALTKAMCTRYFAFVRHAYDAETGRFKNFLSYSRRWLEQHGSEDSHGRALWSLGTVIGHSDAPGRRALAAELFEMALPVVESFTSPRAWGYALLGIGVSLHTFERDAPAVSTARLLACRLLDLYRRCRRPDWEWFEDRVTYCNARLSQAMMVSGRWMDDEEMTASGLRSLEWLVHIQTSEGGRFTPIGSNGFFRRGGPRATFDQQPVEACCMVSACLTARRITGDDRWSGRARQAFDWFLGGNHLGQWLYDAGSGGCRDGLHADRPNENQGAESTLSFLMALIEMRQSGTPVSSPGAPVGTPESTSASAPRKGGTSS